MLRKMLRSKIHRATVTHCDPDYVGSITIDALLLEAAGMLPNEAVAIYDITNAARFETYVIRGEPGSGVIGINGAAAKLVEKGDKVIIASYGLYTEDQLEGHGSQIVLCNDHNGIAEVRRYQSVLDMPAMVE